jgi:hypothetical protein
MWCYSTGCCRVQSYFWWTCSIYVDHFNWDLGQYQANIDQTQTTVWMRWWAITKYKLLFASTTSTCATTGKMDAAIGKITETLCYLKISGQSTQFLKRHIVPRKQCLSYKPTSKPMPKPSAIVISSLMVLPIWILLCLTPSLQLH